MSKPGFPSRATTARVAGAASAVALAAALATACSSGKSSSASNTTPAPPSMSSSSSASGTTVNSGMAAVNGTQTAVLTAPDGHTLYYFTPDTAAGKPTCTGSCASTWTALTAAHPTKAATATGTLSVVSGQVVYNGHPLYEYTGDSASGQAKGEGVDGTWYVATPTLATGAGPSNPMPSAPASPSTSGGGNGGY